MRVFVFNAKAQLVAPKPAKADAPKEHGRRAVVIQFVSGEFLIANSPSQNHYRDQDAADDQAKRYGGRDNFKLVSVL